MPDLMWAVAQAASFILGLALVNSGQVRIIEVIREVVREVPAYIEATPAAKIAPPITKKVVVEETLNTAVNRFRESYSLTPLKTRADLCEAATRRNQEIGSDFSHNNWQAALAGIAYLGIAENIWRGEPASIGRVIGSWEASAGHRVNLLGNWIYGCGVMKDNRAVFLFLR